MTIYDRCLYPTVDEKNLDPILSNPLFLLLFLLTFENILHLPALALRLDRLGYGFFLNPSQTPQLFNLFFRFALFSIKRVSKYRPQDVLVPY